MFRARYLHAPLGNNSGVMHKNKSKYKKKIKRNRKKLKKKTSKNFVKNKKRRLRESGLITNEVFIFKYDLPLDRRGMINTRNEKG